MCLFRRIRYFNPRTPREVRPRADSGTAVQSRISIHAPRERCDLRKFLVAKQFRISIHAPRERCDRKRGENLRAKNHFNPRTPREVRPETAHRPDPVDRFQSTHPARGATLQSKKCSQQMRISIHAPRERCDVCLRIGLDVKIISIHAPRERCDQRIRTIRVFHKNFNPRTPREVRLSFLSMSIAVFAFQSTHPARGATLYWMRTRCCRIFQSTHPARGATRFY